MCSKKVLVMSLLLILVLGACGGGSSGGNPVTPTPAPTQPTAPPSIPAANIIAFGQGQLLSCFFSQCDFQGEARNTGLGCADTVRGTTKLFNGSQQVGTTFSWTLESTRVIRVNEAFTYRTYVGSAVSAGSFNRYETEAAWTNVRCP